jgi:hypothetical protein
MFDSDGRQFLGLQRYTGVLSFAATTLSGYWTNNLGAIPAGAEAVLGAFRVTFPGVPQSSGTPGYGWMAAGGSYVHAAVCGPNYYGYYPYYNDRLVTHDFVIDGGDLLHQRFINNPSVPLYGGGSYQVSYNAYDIEYKLMVGTFT